jgi:endonuclease/exonuclease/phosphatase family metal-dependent hydrolase
MRFNLSTWNAHADVNSLGAANQLKTQIFNVTDVVGLQEFSDKTALDEVRALLLCATCGYDSTITTYTWEGSSPNKVLIVWKKSKFTKVTSGIQNATPPATVNDSTSATVPAKFNVWVKLRENSTGKQFYLINTHFLNGVESGGRPRTENGARLTLYYTHMTKSLELINQLKADNIPIFMTGDFNVNYKYDKDIRSPGFPYVKFPTVGARSTYQILNYTGLSADPGTNSSGDRLIDYIVHVTRPDVTIRSQAISPTQYGSDHYMYTNAIELR